MSQPSNKRARTARASTEAATQNRADLPAMSPASSASGSEFGETAAANVDEDVEIDNLISASAPAPSQSTAPANKTTNQKRSREKWTDDEVAKLRAIVEEGREVSVLALAKEVALDLGSGHSHKSIAGKLYNLKENVKRPRTGTGKRPEFGIEDFCEVFGYDLDVGQSIADLYEDLGEALA